VAGPLSAMRDPFAYPSNYCRSQSCGWYRFGSLMATAMTEESSDKVRSRTLVAENALLPGAPSLELVNAPEL
jgi:hypothetical protein